MNNCPLCGGIDCTGYFTDRCRSYLCCSDCQPVFVAWQCHLSARQEKVEYDLHRNDPGDEVYRGFLDRLCQPLPALLAPASRGLDVGCGPCPTLSVMLEELGHTLGLYDIFYAADEAVLQGQYDFITATGVVEHLVVPGGCPGCNASIHWQ